jgi:hypothetical protein
MKRILFLLILICVEKALHAQYIYTIKADSVKITNSCDTAELIIENHTQNVYGFLFNKGKGRTEFRRGLFNLSDTSFMIGADTLDIGKAIGFVQGSSFFRQGGNNFGSNAILGTKQNHALTFIQNGIERGRIDSTTGHWLFNTTVDKGNWPAQFNGDIYASGKIVQEENITLTSHTTQWGNGRINIGIGNTVAGHGNIAIGHGLNVSGYKSFAVGSYNSVVNEGIAIFGSADVGIAIGDNSYAGYSCVSLGRESVSIAPNQFVCGGPDHFVEPNTYWSNQISDVYFGSGIQRNNVPGNGISYTINGAGAYGTNYAGGNITIAGGKGTGNGKPGNIIFSVASPLGIGTSLQSLSEKVRIAGNSGNFILGDTVDNGHKLQVTGNSHFNGTQQVTGAVRFSGLTNDNSLTRVLVSDANGGVYYRDASSIAFNDVLNSSLAVNGTISAQKMKITQTGIWPDYVFSSTYHLPSLKDVEQFIRQNSHLPGIPSAAEVQKKGIDVGEHQAALLKKIEELTLYTIDQKKEIDFQKEELKSLKEQIAELKTLIKNK